ncbi:hypothetical protein M1O55_03335 [Dehalococcoidia bacterium]|nr:hypothetical protein [Dehalococcoidia bacterium]
MDKLRGLFGKYPKVATSAPTWELADCPAIEFDVNSMSIWIVTYNRPDAVNRAISEWLSTTPDSVPVNVISNHSNLELHEDYGSRVKVWTNSLRPDESWGYLARNWNQAIYLGLRNSKWVICSQDDVSVKPGWIDLIQDNTPYDYYQAPLGDVIFLFNRMAFLRIGWFDERCLCVDGLQDNDWTRRAFQRLGKDRVCIEDGHGWTLHGQDVRGINPIGLSDYWFHGPQVGYVQPNDRPRAAYLPYFMWNMRFMERKWGAKFKTPEFHELNLKQKEEDIDWYPWFTYYLRELVEKGD